MGTMREISNLSNEFANKFIEENERAYTNQLKEMESSYDKIHLIKEQAEERRKKLISFKEDVKFKLLETVFRNIFHNSIKGITESEQNISNNLINSYIKENSADRLLNEFHHKTFLLSEINRLVTKYYNIITENATEDNEKTHIIDPETYDDFCKELNRMEDIDDVTNSIRIRVSNAEEEFITSNLTDKINIEEIIKSTSDRVDSIKQDEDSFEDENAAETAHEEAVNLQKQYIYNVKNRNTRSLFEQMVKNLSTSALKNNTLHEYYIDNGLNMDKVVGTTRCMYTMLEMLNTMKIETIDEEYIDNFLKSI